MEFRRDRRGRPMMPLGRLWIWLAACGVCLVAGLVLLVPNTRTPGPARVLGLVLTFVAFGLVVVFCVLGARRAREFITGLPQADRDRYYAAVPAPVLWRATGLLVVLTGLAIWASSQDLFGFDHWTNFIGGPWGILGLVAWRSRVVRRARRQTAS